MPLQGLRTLGRDLFPGRWPGLCSVAPSGLKAPSPSTPGVPRDIRVTISPKGEGCVIGFGVPSSGCGRPERSTLRHNHRHQIIPGLDEGLCPFRLKLPGQRIDIDSSFGKLR